MNKEEFIKEVENLSVEVTEEKLTKLSVYADFLLEYNTHTNLTAIRDLNEVYLKHFYDSLTLIKVIDLSKESTLLDIGSGAGFPGMVLKIFFPNLSVVLVDSNNKKTKFLTLLKEKLGVNNLEVINDRIENITPQYLNHFDIVTARAVTNMPVLTELAMPLVKKDKYFIAMKGNNGDEIENGIFTIKKLNGVVEEIINFKLYNNEGERTIIKIKKIQDSILNNLRPYEKIIKKPIIK